MRNEDSGCTYILELDGVTKRYPGVLAIDNVSLKVKRGTVHALLGENGAGKSTLIKVIAGAIQPDSGAVKFEGNTFSRIEPKAAMDIGISVIYQELNLIPSLTVANNIFLGNEPVRGGWINERACEERTRELLSDLDISVDPKSQVRMLSVGYQQLIEIAKAVSKNVKLLIMDEPTASLSEKEVGKLFKLVRQLRSNGITIIYISHRLDELFEIADEVTVLRDGLYIDTLKIGECDRSQLISLMVGRGLAENYPKSNSATDEVVLKVEGLCTGKIRDVNFELHRSEVLGFGGLVGSGRTEVARALFGADRLDAGRIFVNGKPVTIRSPQDAVKLGLAFLTEDRKQQGLLMKLSVRENITITYLDKLIRRWPSISKKLDNAVSRKSCEQLGVKTPSIEQIIKNLSGGNQQKVVLAKWLLTNSNIIIFDEPTRGIDVGTKFEIYELIRDMAREGKSIIIISSEMPELLGISDRILVMNRGRLAGELKRGEATQQAIMSMATLS